MKHRTWLPEVLRLHFEEKLPRIEAGRRLGIPKTTACDLFVRFMKTGLSWPLPPRINAKIWINAFTDRHPENPPFHPVPRSPVKSLSPANDHNAPTSPATSKSHWWSSRCSPASAWHSLPVKITLMTICCSTGGAFISRGCWLRGQTRRSCCPWRSRLNQASNRLILPPF